MQPAAVAAAAAAASYRLAFAAADASLLAACESDERRTRKSGAQFS